MGDYGLKISREGASISSSDVRDLVLDSKYKTFKTRALATDSVTIPSGNSGAQKQIAHGLGYVPMFFVAAELGSGKYFNIFLRQYFDDGSNSFEIYASVDATNLTVTVLTTDFSGVPADKTIPFSYYISIDQVV